MSDLHHPTLYILVVQSGNSKYCQNPMSARSCRGHCWLMTTEGNMADFWWYNRAAQWQQWDRGCAGRNMISAGYSFSLQANKKSPPMNLPCTAVSSLNLCQIRMFVSECAFEPKFSVTNMFCSAGTQDLLSLSIHHRIQHSTAFSNAASKSSHVADPSDVLWWRGRARPLCPPGLVVSWDDPLGELFDHWIFGSYQGTTTYWSVWRLFFKWDDHQYLYAQIHGSFLFGDPSCTGPASFDFIYAS